MKQIQWYPGHMVKSIRQISENLNKMDLVFILLDARLPLSSMNPKILKLLENKRVIILFNKMDLADLNKTLLWQEYYQKLGFETLMIDSNSGKNIHLISDKATKLMKDVIDKNKQKGLLTKAFRVMIVGIPNVGKSTLINRLAGKNVTKTANKPGVTKSQQWIKLNEQFDLLDTPGVLWPKFEDPKVGYHLAITGAIKDHILPMDDVCAYAIKHLQTHYLKALQARYSVNILESSTFIEVLDEIGKLRGAKLNKNEYDYDRIYQIILTDIRSKALGGITFDIVHE